MKRTLALGAALVVLASCSSTTDDRELTVMVAASLCDLAENVEEALDFDVTTVCSGSADLVAQIEAGADADILITANQSTADTIVDGGFGHQIDVVASNELVMVVPQGNPAAVTGFNETMNAADLIVCAPQVPCGDVSVQLAAANEIDLSPVSEEQSVTDVLGKITSGQGDVGLVYRTDANSAGESVETIDIPRSEEFPNIYPLLLIGSDAADDVEQEWIDAFTTGDGKARMEALGFKVQ
ncbi:molybdate ABC transporter substrate-binding protein [Flaviflexus huanghaiensis]|uniref:molybdate ABC transporter substrate-binding protein n=1 Tax=Flaviflexus huanghaiensis TaxID=1111473 RepID=UPI0015FDFDC8|nr:substrate-binding domain-containing protein [Flaviflexus huanghaiensis]